MSSGPEQGMSGVPDQAQVQEPEEQLAAEDGGGGGASLQPSPGARPAPASPAPAPTTTEGSGPQDHGPGVASNAHHPEHAPATLAMQATQPEEARPTAFPQQQFRGGGGRGSGSIHGSALTQPAGSPVLPAAGAPAVPPVLPPAGNVPPPVVLPVEEVLPPPGAECQLPGDLVEVYGIKATRVLTSSEPPSP
jgi:hypothetical protein